MPGGGGGGGGAGGGEMGTEEGIGGAGGGWVGLMLARFWDCAPSLNLQVLVGRLQIRSSRRPTIKET